MLGKILHAQKPPKHFPEQILIYNKEFVHLAESLTVNIIVKYIQQS
jgi:hypothetical protein